MTRRVIAALGLNWRTSDSRCLPTDHLLAPDCASARSRTHWSPHPKTPNRVVGLRLESIHNHATVFGSWEELSGKPQVSGGRESLASLIVSGDGFGGCAFGRCGVYHGLRRKYLQTYLDEFVFGFNRRRTLYAAFRSLFAIALYAKPATYDMLVRPEQRA